MKEIQLFRKASSKEIFLRLAIPNIISSIILILYGIIDGIFVGTYAGPEGLAAINICLPIIGFSVAIVNMISIGASVQIGIKLGEEKYSDANNIFTFSLFIQLIYSLIIMLLGLIFAEDLFKLMGVSEIVLNYSLEYIRVHIYVMPLFMLAYGIPHYIRVAGGTMLNMYAEISSAILNIILDYIFIVKFGWGAKGAAIATCISAVFLGVFLISFFIRDKFALKFSKLIVNWKELRIIMFNGSSEFFTSIAGSISGFIINIVIIKLVNDLGIAALSVVLYLENIIMSILFGIGDGIQPAISYNYGSKEFKRMWEILKYSIIMGLCISVVVFILVFIFKKDIAKLFIKDGNEELLKMAINAVKIYIFSIPFSFLSISASLFFTAVGKPIESIIISISNTLVFKIIFINILPRIFGIDGVWYTLVISTVLSFFISMILLYRGKKNIELERSGSVRDYGYKKIDGKEKNFVSS